MKRGTMIPHDPERISPAGHYQQTRGDETLGLREQLGSRELELHPFPRVLQGYESFDANASPSVKLDTCLTEITPAYQILNFYDPRQVLGRNPAIWCSIYNRWVA